MRLLLDTDAFCKLAAGGLLDDAIAHLGGDMATCGRLAALPHMLRRGKLRRTLGAETCDAILAVAEALPVIGQPTSKWLDGLAHIDSIDPGEAQIFAFAAETSAVVLSGDKRALRALKAVQGLPQLISGRIVVMEAILIGLCERLGVDEIRRRVQPIVAWDKMIQICFSPTNLKPQDALRSYFRSLASELEPIVLWSPGGEGNS